VAAVVVEEGDEDEELEGARGGGHVRQAGAGVRPAAAAAGWGEGKASGGGEKICGQVRTGKRGRVSL